MDQPCCSGNEGTLSAGLPRGCGELRSFILPLSTGQERRLRVCKAEFELQGKFTSYLERGTNTAEIGEIQW